MRGLCGSVEASYDQGLKHGLSHLCSRSYYYVGIAGDLGFIFDLPEV